MLNFSAREIEPDQSSSVGMKFGRGAQDISLMLPLFLAAAHDDGLRRHQFLKRFGVAREPGPPHGFADAQEFVVILLSGYVCRAQGGYERCGDDEALPLQLHDDAPLSWLVCCSV